MKMLNLGLLAFFLFSLTSFAQEAQIGTLKGIVTDKENGEPLPFVNITIKDISPNTGSQTNIDGLYTLQLAPGKYDIGVSYIGYKTIEKTGIQIETNKTTVLDFQLDLDKASLGGVIVQGCSKSDETVLDAPASVTAISKDRHNSFIGYQGPAGATGPVGATGGAGPPGTYFSSFNNESITTNAESYDTIQHNKFKSPLEEPLSTFSIDVDAASYTNVRRFLDNGQRPPKDAVRLEEMINYFTYDYPQPTDEHPFAITTEMGTCPWNKQHKLIHIGLQGKNIETKDLPPNNLVFLLDVSGSMNDPNKLPLVQESLKLLVDQMQATDKVAIVVYAGAAGLVLPSTPFSDKQKILEAIENLKAGGSTAGGAGIELAYKTAKENFIKDGNNRVILCTDGDFNVGASSDQDMVKLIEEKRNDGIFLSVLGYGMGNYKDSKMEKISNAGNGNYAYIDDLKEAKKVLVQELTGTLYTIAKDVKIQVDFNTEKVAAYRLIGYENRLMAAKDFDDDKKDAGEIGAGHSVTALYEIIPTGINSKFKPKVSKEMAKQKMTKDKDEWLTVKFRYKKPDGKKSQLLSRTIKNIEDGQFSNNFRFSAAVAYTGMILRESEYIQKQKEQKSYESLFVLAKSAQGTDKEGYRAEFIELLEKLKKLPK